MQSGKKRSSSVLDSWELKQLKAAGSLKAEDEDDALPDIKVKSSYETAHDYHASDPRLAQFCYSDSPLTISSAPQNSLCRAASNAKDITRNHKRSLPSQSTNPFNHLPRPPPRPSPSASHSALPIREYKEEIISLVNNSRFSVIVGETGSGKTTQIPQYLLTQPSLLNNKAIAVTQPRRVAAISVANRVASERCTTLGDEVGYKIRFEDVSSLRCKILYQTDGILLKELQSDPLLSRYSIIMIDEAHERSVNTDLLIGLLWEVIQKRSDLRVIITSATLDSKKFVDFFDCPSLFVPGRQHPVEVFYSKSFEPDYLASTIDTLEHILMSLENSKDQKDGDVLIFLTGAEEIEIMCDLIRERSKSLKTSLEILPLPLYSSQSTDQQRLVFTPAPVGFRKVIVATNIAETSVTIDGVVYVIDCGFMKIKSFNSKLNMDQLSIVPISKANARQRSGRAGRTRPGKCFRLYTHSAYQSEMIDNPIPEILRSNLVSVVLLLKSLGIDDVLSFKFIDSPSIVHITNAINSLKLLEALDEEGRLTQLGRRLTEFPLSPNVSKMLLASVDLQCSKETIVISAMLSVEDVFYRPVSRKSIKINHDDVMGLSSGSSQLARAESAHSRFVSAIGDHITLLNVYSKWEESNYSFQWCKNNFVHYRALKEASEIVKQLSDILRNLKLPILTCNRNKDLIKAISVGHFMKIAKRNGDSYRTLLGDSTVYIHPSSCLFHRQPKYLVYNELVLTSKEYMRCVSIVDPKWLVKVCPKLFALD
ncbi:hypothetical protein P9112_011943 [Eukaryota sp. TZLM1-RC]